MLLLIPKKADKFKVMGQNSHIFWVKQGINTKKGPDSSKKQGIPHHFQVLRLSCT